MNKFRAYPVIQLAVVKKFKECLVKGSLPFVQVSSPLNWIQCCLKALDDLGSNHSGVGDLIHTEGQQPCNPCIFAVDSQENQ